MGDIVKLQNDWHMCVSVGEIVDDHDLAGHIIVGTQHGLMKMADRKLARGVWDCVWVFPPGSDSHPEAPHPGNGYWVGEMSPDPNYVSWIDLDE